MAKTKALHPSGNSRFLQPLLEIGVLEGRNHFVQVAFHDAVEIVEGQADPMIGDAVLRKVIGANLFFAAAGSDLAFAVSRIFRLFLALFVLEQASAQDA